MRSASLSCVWPQEPGLLRLLDGVAEDLRLRAPFAFRLEHTAPVSGLDHLKILSHAGLRSTSATIRSALRLCFPSMTWTLRSEAIAGIPELAPEQHRGEDRLRRAVGAEHAAVVHPLGQPDGIAHRPRLKAAFPLYWGRFCYLCGELDGRCRWRRRV